MPSFSHPKPREVPTVRAKQLIESLREALEQGELELALKLSAQGRALHEVNDSPDFAVLEGWLESRCVLGPVRNLQHDVTWDIQYHAGRRSQIACCAMTPDASTAIAVLQRGALMVWKGPDAAPQLISSAVPEPRAVTLSEDGTMAMILPNTLPSVPLWNLETAECTGELSGHTQPITACALRSDGKRAWTVADDLRTWSTVTRESLRRKLLTHTPTISLVPTSDGRRLFSLSASGVLTLHTLDPPGTGTRTWSWDKTSDVPLLTAEGMCLSLNEARILCVLRLAAEHAPVLCVIEPQRLVTLITLPIPHLDPSQGRRPLSLACDAHGHLAVLSGCGLSPQLIEVDTGQSHLLPVNARSVAIDGRGEWLLAALDTSLHRFRVHRNRLYPPRLRPETLWPHIDALLLRRSKRSSMLRGAQALDDDDFAWLARRVANGILPVSDEALRLELERRAARYRRPA